MTDIKTDDEAESLPANCFRSSKADGAVISPVALGCRAELVLPEETLSKLSLARKNR